jgi:hypothetical protein
LKIPEQVVNLKNLQVLSLSKNKLFYLPTYLAELKELRLLKVDKNPLKSPSPEILRLYQDEKLSLQDLLNGLQKNVVELDASKPTLDGEHGKLSISQLESSCLAYIKEHDVQCRAHENAKIFELIRSLLLASSQFEMLIHFTMKFDPRIVVLENELTKLDDAFSTFDNRLMTLLEDKDVSNVEIRAFIPDLVTFVSALYEMSLNIFQIDYDFLKADTPAMFLLINAVYTFNSLLKLGLQNFGKIVNSLLDSLPDSNKAKISKQTLELFPLLDAICKDLRDIINNKAVSDQMKNSWEKVNEALSSAQKAYKLSLEYQDDLRAVKSFYHRISVLSSMFMKMTVLLKECSKELQLSKPFVKNLQMSITLIKEIINMIGKDQ